MVPPLLRLLLVFVFLGMVGPQMISAADIDFSHEIVPILRKHCGECHTGSASQGDFSLNTRQQLLDGGAAGPAAVLGDVDSSALLQRILSTDPDQQMPPEGPRLTLQEIDTLRRWIAADLPWEPGFSFAPTSYDPPLLLRRPELPAAVDRREHPVDRIIDNYLVAAGQTRPQPLDDGHFIRRVSLDLTGLLPEPEALQNFLNDPSPSKRADFIAELLANETDYAEHWLSFWNDLLRNDYDGTGFITGGRKQISTWLYNSLITNKPYDQFARELLAPTAESTGFADGIRWRGTVSAGQTVEIQFAQSVGQSFLGINLKCASCHDSFIDRWKLEDAYGLAAIYAESPQEIHRCDKPLGKTAQAKWMFPELGQIDPQAARPERLQQLANLMTHPDNGRFARTLVNRLWHRLMGRGVVHPLDAMETAPWNEDLLDYLASDFVDHGYDLKHTLTLIATSQAYQSQSQIVSDEHAAADYRYAGPHAKRLTAEQFVDALWQITGAAPTSIDAPVSRGPILDSTQQLPLAGNWVWSSSDGSAAVPLAGESLTVARTLSLAAMPTRASAVITCDNSFTLYVNQRRVSQSENWEQPQMVDLLPFLRPGDNRFLIVARNAGDAPNPAGLFFAARWQMPDGTQQSMGTDQQWEWTSSLPQAIDNGNAVTFTVIPNDWQPMALVANPNVWIPRVGPALQKAWQDASGLPAPMVRASLRKSDFLQRTLGRPNRDQIVSARPDLLSTLEAIDLNNAQMLADLLNSGAQRITAAHQGDPQRIIDWLYSFALSRQPTDGERSLAMESMGNRAEMLEVEDLLWAILMQPEFMIVR
jgi:hypothetical protein